MKSRWLWWLGGVVLGLVLLGGVWSLARSKPAPAPSGVTTSFDTETLRRLDAFFSVNFDLGNLGRIDPFVGL